jgi:hypothetical protein
MVLLRVPIRIDCSRSIPQRHLPHHFENPR